MERLTKFKAEFENLAEGSLNGSDSDGLKGGEGGAAAGCGGGKWKQQAKRLQKYVKWQLAEAENQVKTSVYAEQELCLMELFALKRT